MDTLFLICISAAIGFFIGNHQKSQRKAQFEREQDRIDAEFMARHVRNGRIAYDRDLYLRQREGYLRNMVALNKKSYDESGVVYKDINASMAEYDKRHLEEWYKAGMVPPTYANNVNYYNDKNKLNEWIN